MMTPRKIPLEAFRQHYNEAFTYEKYAAFLKEVHPFYDEELDFRIAETPVFVSKEFGKEMLGLFSEVKNFLETSDLKALTSDAVPVSLNMPGETPHPCFLAIDFAVCQNENGDLYPQLIELQGVASLFCYQRRLGMAYQKYFGLPNGFSMFLEGMDNEKYMATLKELLIADVDPERVILLDIEPEKQKTRIDFHYTDLDLGISAVCMTKIKVEGNKLYYVKKGRRIPIERIYNRVIPDEFNKKQHSLKMEFEWLKKYDVTWLEHPNWFFRVSKYLMPFMESHYVPKSYFLHKMEQLPKDLENYVLKPLFSFAGAGLHFDVTAEIIEGLNNPQDFILQEKVAYAPFLPTQDVPAKVEIRMLCTWKDEIKPVMHLARLSKGKIIGVDFNKDKTWVGGSAVFFE